MSDQKLLHRLKVWRAQQAAREGVEPYRVLPNATLEALAERRPVRQEEFFTVKGFKEAKWQRYGTMLLPMMADAVEMEEQGVGRDAPLARLLPETAIQYQAETHQYVSTETTKQGVVSRRDEKSSVFAESCVSVDTDDDVYTVSSFLNLLNDSFAGLFVRVRGEVSSVSPSPRVLYFSLKDPQDGSLMSCLIFHSHYELCGVSLEIGQEVIIEGRPEVYKPNGRLSLKATTVELVGEGALQKAYNDLKKKLEQEGIFAEEKKRPLPDCPERIALITSRDGAAIGDFMMNLGRYGFKVSLYHSSVEGMRAVSELSNALKQVAKQSHHYDALVIIRGGGSFESLQAFNNETLVRAVADFPIPVLAGIGHERDVSLVALAADAMVSTPTATAKALSESWLRAESQLARQERHMLEAFERGLQANVSQINEYAGLLAKVFERFFQRFVRAEQYFVRCIDKLRFSLLEDRKRVDRYPELLARRFAARCMFAKHRLDQLGSVLRSRNPEQLLKLGYSLVFKEGKLVRSARAVSPGDTLQLRLADGSIPVAVTNTENS